MIFGQDSWLGNTTRGLVYGIWVATRRSVNLASALAYTEMHLDQTASAETPDSFDSRYHTHDVLSSKSLECSHSLSSPPPGQTHQGPSYQEGENPAPADLPSLAPEDARLAHLTQPAY